jgi:hypothetical protein
MKLTVTESVSLDGVMQGLGGRDEDRRGGFERGGWQNPACRCTEAAPWCAGCSKTSW